MKKAQILEIIKEEVGYHNAGLEVYDTWEDCSQAQYIFDIVKNFGKNVDPTGMVAPNIAISRDLYDQLVATIDREDQPPQRGTDWLHTTTDTITAFALLADAPAFVSALEDKIGKAGTKLLYRRVGYSLRELYVSRTLDNFDPKLLMRLMKNVQALLKI